MRLFGKRIRIYTAFREFLIVPAPESTVRIYSDGIEIDERNTSEPRVYLIKLNKNMKDFLATLEAYNEVTLYCPKYKVARKFYERNYNITDKDGIVLKVERTKGFKKVTYEKFYFLNCKVG